MSFDVSLHSTKDRTVRSVEIGGYEPIKTESGKWEPVFSVVSLASKEGKISSTPGAYVLVGPIADENGIFPAYVGQSTSGGVGDRLRSHVGKIFSQAVVLHTIKENGKQKEITEGQALRLEYFIYEELSFSKYRGLELANTNSPTPLTTFPKETKAFEQFAKISVDIIKLLLGVNVNEPISESICRKVIKEYCKRLKCNGVDDPINDIAKLIKAGGLNVGEKLETTSPSYPGEAIVGLENDGKGYIQVLRCLDENRNIIKDKKKKKFYSPSGAGKYVTGYPTPGWIFWRLASDGKTTLDILRKKYL